MTTIVKTINPATKAIVQTSVDSSTASLNIAPNTIVEIQAGRTQIAAFIQNGKNLVLVMVDGTEIVLQGYFDNAEGAVKKLILTDENGSVEVQFPAADGSVADGAPVDVAPSYVAADAATTASLTDGAEQGASASGISPVLLGLLGVGGVAAALAGGGGGGDSAAPAVQPEQPLVPTEPETKTESKTEIESETKTESKTEIEPEPKVEPEVEVLSPADLVAQIKMLSAVLLVSKDDTEMDSSDFLILQQKLLGLKPAVAAKIAELEQSDAVDDQHVKVELQMLDGMLNRFSSALEYEANLSKAADNCRLDQKEDDLDMLQSFLDKFEESNGDLESAFANLKSSLKEKIAAVENDELKDELSTLIESAKDDEDSVSELRDAIDSALEDAGPFAGSEEISDAIESLDTVAHDIGVHKELVEDVREATRELHAAEQESEKIAEMLKEIGGKSFDALSPVVLLSEIDALQDVQDELASTIVQANTLGQAAIDDAKEIATELQDAKDAQAIASDAYYKTTSFFGLVGGDAAKLAARELANDRLKIATERDVQVKESIALAKELTDDANNLIKANSEEIAQKEAELYGKLTVEEDSHQIVEPQPELPSKILGEIVQLGKTASGMDAAGFKANSLLQKALHDAEQPAVELKEAKDAFDIVASHETRANAKIFQSTEERLHKAEAADALAKEAVSDAQKIANEIEGSIKAIKEELAQKNADFHISAKFYGTHDTDTDLDNNDQSNKVEAGTDNDTASKVELSMDDLAKDLFSENTESGVPSPSIESDHDVPAVLQDTFADQPQLIVQ